MLHIDNRPNVYVQSRMRTIVTRILGTKNHRNPTGPDLTGNILRKHSYCLKVFSYCQADHARDFDSESGIIMAGIANFQVEYRV